MSQAKTTTDKTAAPSPPSITATLQAELTVEITAMTKFALKNGLTIDPQVSTQLSSDAFEDQMAVHAQLVKDVAPATPKSIMYLNRLHTDEEKKSYFDKLPILRNLILLTLIFLAIFIGTGLSPNVTDESVALSIMKNSGLKLLLNLGFIASASGLGVLFSMLRNVTIGIKNGTLVPEDSIYYSAVIILGIIAGLIISEVIPFNSIGGNDAPLFNNAALALIGGFSSDAIFALLQTAVNKIKSIFSAS